MMTDDDYDYVITTILVQYFFLFYFIQSDDRNDSRSYVPIRLWDNLILLYLRYLFEENIQARI